MYDVKNIRKIIINQGYFNFLYIQKLKLKIRKDKRLTKFNIHRMKYLFFKYFQMFYDLQ